MQKYKKECIAKNFFYKKMRLRIEKEQNTATEL